MGEMINSDEFSMVRLLLNTRSPGEMIAAIRKERHYSQEKLEMLSGISRTQISRIERDRVSPSISTIRRLETALDVSLMELFRDEYGVAASGAPNPHADISEMEWKMILDFLSGMDRVGVLDDALKELKKMPERMEGAGVENNDRNP